jgi:hypothetical protein
VRRPASVRAAIARSREARLRAVERRLVRRDPLAHDALIRLLHRVVAANRAIQGSTRPRVPVPR